MTGWRWRLRTWSPDYDSPRAPTGGTSAPRVDAGLETIPRSWSARRPQAPPGDPGTAIFVDGVQRIDAWADLEGPDGERTEALFASVAAGAVRVEPGGRAVLTEARVRRLLVGGPPGQLAVSTGRAEIYEPCSVRSTNDQSSDRSSGAVEERERSEGIALEVALQVARDALEVEVAAAASDERGAIVVVDGPLHHRDHLLGAVGHIKSHRVEYLTDPWLRQVVNELQPGERTPLFLIDAGWTRWSWYSRLGMPSSPARGSFRTDDANGWGALVRGEASGRLDVAEAGARADQATRTVARFASSPVKDSRAPQNLVPVGGLERILRHRLGERELLERSLRLALAG